MIRPLKLGLKRPHPPTTCSDVTQNTLVAVSVMCVNFRGLRNEARDYRINEGDFQRVSWRARQIDSS